MRVLIGILDSLLDREQRKTVPSVRELGLDSDAAYGRDEQLAWLAADLLGGPPPALAWCPQARRGEYVKRISEFLRDHPFRAEDAWASPVFAAYVASRRFDDVLIRRELQAVGARTGLLFDFVTSEGAGHLIDEWQFAALHSSMLAAEWQALEAAVSIEPEAADGTLDLVEGELILLESNQTRRRSFQLALDVAGTLRILGPTSFLSADFPGVVVISAASGTLSLGPECFVRCKDLHIDGDTIEIARRALGQDHERADEPTVLFEVSEHLALNGTLVGNPPVDIFELRVSDRIPLVYPWITYRSTLATLPAEPDERAARFLNMLMSLLRRHGHAGRMAVFDKKFQGRQSFKHEDFAAIVGDLEQLGIISHEGALIYLQPDWEQHWFSGKGRPGLPSLDEKREAWSEALEAISRRVGGQG